LFRKIPLFLYFGRNLLHEILCFCGVLDRMPHEPPDHIAIPFDTLAHGTGFPPTPGAGELERVMVSLLESLFGEDGIQLWGCVQIFLQWNP